MSESLPVAHVVDDEADHGAAQVVNYAPDRDAPEPVQLAQYAPRLPQQAAAQVVMASVEISAQTRIAVAASSTNSSANVIPSANAAPTGSAAPTANAAPTVNASNTAATVAQPWCCPLMCTLVVSTVFGVLSVMLSLVTLLVNISARGEYWPGMLCGFVAVFTAMFVAGPPAAASGCCRGCKQRGLVATCRRTPEVIYPRRRFAWTAHRLMIATYAVGSVASILVAQTWSCSHSGSAVAMCVIPAVFCVAASCLALSSVCLFAKDRIHRIAMAQEIERRRARSARVRHLRALGAAQAAHTV